MMPGRAHGPALMAGRGELRRQVIVERMANQNTGSNYTQAIM